MRTRWRHVLLVVAVVTLGAGGCAGGGEGTAGPNTVLAAAPAKTIAAGTSEVAIDVAVQGQERGAFQGDGKFDFANQTGRLELDLGPLGLAGAGRTEILFTADVVYIKLGLPLPQLAQRPWLKIDLDELAKGQGAGIDALRQLQANDPTAVLNYLRGVTGEVSELGRETVRGASTTRYRATLDLDKAAAASPVEARDDLSNVRKQLGTSRIPTEAWIDDEGRLRRLRYTIDLSKLSDSAPAKGSGKGIVTASFELFGFGVDVDVAPPPADQITALEELIASTGGR